MNKLNCFQHHHPFMVAEFTYLNLRSQLSGCSSVQARSSVAESRNDTVTFYNMQQQEGRLNLSCLLFLRMTVNQAYRLLLTYKQMCEVCACVQVGGKENRQQFGFAQMVRPIVNKLCKSQLVGQQQLLVFSEFSLNPSDDSPAALNRVHQDRGHLHGKNGVKCTQLHIYYCKPTQTASPYSL